MHEITGSDRVVLIEGHPLSGMGNWHGLGEAWRWDDVDTPDNGLSLDLVREVLGVGTWEVVEVELADTRRQVAPWEVARTLRPVGGTEAYDLLTDAGYLILGPDALLTDHKGIACGAENAPHYFPTARYGVVQNEALVDLAGVFQEAALVERGVTVPVLSVGTLADRRKAFVSLGVPDDQALDGLVDIRNHALNLGSSHDGSCCLRGSLATFVVVCGNTFRASLLGHAPIEVAIRHTSGVDDQVQDARRILRDMIGAASETDAAIARLLDTPYRADRFLGAGVDAILTEEYGERPTEDGRTLTNWDTRRDALRWEYGSPRVPAGVRGTAWGAVMATQGWEQHEKQQNQGDRNRAAVAIERTITGGTDSGYPVTNHLVRLLPELTEAAA